MVINLIVAEHDGKNLANTTLSAVTAARQLNDKCCYGIVLGNNINEIGRKFASYVDIVYLIDNSDLTYKVAKNYAEVISIIAKKNNATHIWMGSSVWGKELMPRVSIKLNGSFGSDINSVINEDIFKRSMYAGNILSTIKLLSKIKVITVRSTEFVIATPINSGILKDVKMGINNSLVKFINFDAIQSERPKLTDASVVVSGGRGVKSKDGFKTLIEPLANKLNAAIGASRAVCDAGWVPNDWQVGQTGKIIAPDLYIAIGISGAIQHVAGIKSAKIIVAINNDADASIFDIADYGLVADAFVAVPELIKMID